MDNVVNERVDKRTLIEQVPLEDGLASGENIDRRPNTVTIYGNNDLPIKEAVHPGVFKDWTLQVQIKPGEWITISSLTKLRTSNQYGQLIMSSVNPSNWWRQLLPNEDSSLVFAFQINGENLRAGEITEQVSPHHRKDDPVLLIPVPRGDIGNIRWVNKGSLQPETNGDELVLSNTVQELNTSALSDQNTDTQELPLEGPSFPQSIRPIIEILTDHPEVLVGKNLLEKIQEKWGSLTPTEKIYYTNIVAFCGLQAMDLATTFGALSKGGSEGNPIMKNMVENYFPIAIFVKANAPVISHGYLHNLIKLAQKKYPENYLRYNFMVLNSLRLVNISYTFVAISNLVGIINHW